MNDLTTLPFDSSQDNLREITAAQRRMLYRDLWSDMIVEQFSFVAVGSGNFEVSGVCLVSGAYARFDRFMLSTADVVAGATNVVTRIEADGHGGQDVFIRLVDTVGANDLRIGTATIVAGPAITQIAGFGPSPIRIPDRTIAGTKLADRTITNAQIADNAINTRTIADGTLPVHQFIESISSTSSGAIPTSWAIVPVPNTQNSFVSGGVITQGTQGVTFRQAGTYRVSVRASVRNPIAVGTGLSSGSIGIRQAAGQEIVLGGYSINGPAASQTVTAHTIIRANANSSLFLVARASAGNASPSIPTTMLVETWQPWL